MIQFLFVFPITPVFSIFIFFFFNDTAPTEIYTLSLHDALPIYLSQQSMGDAQLSPADRGVVRDAPAPPRRIRDQPGVSRDRKSTRLNSSHVSISYAVFCLKKKKKRLY